MAADRYESKYRASQAVKEGMEKELDELEGRIARLRVLYDQYFMGIEKMEPTFLRAEVEKMFRRSQILKLGTTVLKFRFRSLQQRYTSYRSYWDRIVRLIEDGHIRRGINVMANTSPRFPGQEEGAAEQENPAERQQPKESLSSRRRRFRRQREDGTLDDAVKEAAAQLSPGTPPERSTAREAPRSDFEPSELRPLFERLVEEKRKAGEPTDKLSMGLVEKSVQKILEKVPDKNIRFRVVNKDGRVSLTAVVKKD
jgi:hypothetical protein